ncbi:MAG: hypothetical protein FWF29_00065 [Treponema sp.]|nr:hypothetical protein [Treponema sp.]
MGKKYLYLTLVGLIPLVCSVCSCSTGEAAAHILGTSSQAPVFLACKAVSGTEIDFEFSQPVRIISLNFTPPVDIESIEDGNVVRVNITDSLAPGEKLTADLLATDEKGNTINVLAPLRTRNNRIPKLLINELRTEYSKPKAEFIEFKILEAGNLAAVRVFIAGNNTTPLVYEFSSVEVSAGEYILLHLRTMEDACCDEYGASKDASGGTDAVAGVRDFWVPGTVKLLRKTDAVYVLDQDDNVINAVMLSETQDNWWNKDYLAAAANFLYENNAWKSSDGRVPGPKDAVNSANIKTAMTRSISRDETVPNTDTAADWYISATSGITPGKPNNPARF